LDQSAVPPVKLTPFHAPSDLSIAQFDWLADTPSLNGVRVGSHQQNLVQKGRHMRLFYRYTSPSPISGLLAVFAVAIGMASTSPGALINFDTSLTSTWTVTGAGSVNAPAFHLALPEVSITSNSLRTGTFGPGGSLAQFTGAWYSDFLFTLPADATNVSLNFTNLVGDDRVVLQLNGTSIGDWFLNGNIVNPSLAGPGAMRFSGQTSDTPYTFTGQTSGTVTSGFAAGVNDLRLVVNNTGVANLNATTVTFQNSSDAANAGVLGNIVYSEPTPEPAGVALIALSSIAILRRGQRQ